MRRSVAIFAIAALLGGCPRPRQTTARPPTPPCPAEVPAPPTLPHHAPVHDLAGFWLQQVDEPDALLLDAQRIAEHNRGVREQRHEGLPSGRWGLETLPVDWPRVEGALADDIQKLRQAVTEGKRVRLDGARPGALLERIAAEVAATKPAGELRAVHRSAPLRCYPTDEGLYEKGWEEAFDLAQCAQLRPGEPVRVLGKGKAFWYVWSSYARGWVRPGALTPPLEGEQARRFLAPARFVVVIVNRLALWADRDGQGLLSMVRLGARLPLEEAPESGPLRVTVPTPSGLTSAWIRDRAGVREGYLPLTRRNVLELAFGLLDSPYGWGGLGGHRDCSRFMMDLFAVFGVELPRNSWNQSQAGTDHVEVQDLDEGAKREAIQKAAGRGVVLLYLPGHIMLYLGRDDDRLHALHQFSGYLTPCRGAQAARPQRGKTETMVRVNRAAVTSLELGRGTSRTAFIERITRLVLLGG